MTWPADWLNLDILPAVRPSKSQSKMLHITRPLCLSSHRLHSNLVAFTTITGYFLSANRWRHWRGSYFTVEMKLMYEDHKISFQTFFVWALLLIVHTWNSSPLWSNILRLQCACCTVPTTSGRPMEVLLCEHVNDFRHSLFHLLNSLITTASELRE